MTQPIETDVFIVGTGPAGAAAALALASAGVKNIAITRYRSTSPDPRAHITNQRAMEFFRDCGLEQAAKQISTPWSFMGEHVFAASLAGEEFGRISAWARSAAAIGEHLAASPSTYCDLPQLYMEPLIVGEASQRGADIRFHTEYLSHQQDAGGVTVRLRDRLNQHDYEVRAKYLIGADGARSKVAADIGLRFDGAMGMGETGSINIEFKADLSAYADHRRSDMYWMLQTGPNLNGFAKGPGFAVMRMVRPWDRWVCVVGYDMAKEAPSLADADVIPLVHRTLGFETPIEVISTSTWGYNRQYALNNTKGRVFCMGDAVHRHTPFGGLGANTCIQDAYNLAWKLALVIKGQAGPGLLASYEAERAPIAKQITEHAFNGPMSLGSLFQALELPPGASAEDMARSLARMKEPTPEGAERRAALRRGMDSTLPGFGSGHGVELNQRYVSGAIEADGTPDPGFARDPVTYYQPSTRPGAHLPHAWLTHAQHKVSTLDLCGKGRFTLLTGLAGQTWSAAAAAAARELGLELPTRVIGPGQEYVDSYGEWARLSEIDESGALLVRPDMMIAWRAPNNTQAMQDQLLPVLRKILSRD
jgi:2,4-dichlorophenol 6-monooxygenase